MSYVAHDAVLVVTGEYRPGGLPDMDAFRASIPEEFRRLVVGPIQTHTNGYVLYAFLPDGSKEGWDTSNLGDELRDRFRELFHAAYEDGSSPDEVVSVRFGGELGYESPPVVEVNSPPVIVDVKGD